MGKRIVLTVLIGVLALTGGRTGSAQDENVVPQSIIVPPAKSELSVEIRTDRELYRPGEAVQIQVKLSRDAYVYIYDIDPAGRVTLLFPNGFSRDNFLKAGEHPLPDGDYSFVVTEPEGVESLQAIALLQPIPLLELSAQGDLDRHAFPQLGESAQALKPRVVKMIEVTVGPGEWAADWTQFLVARAIVWLHVTTEPSGAQVYVNDKLRGQSPLELTLEPGRVRVTLEKEGYRPWSKTITLGEGVRHELSVQLTRPWPEPRFPPLEAPEGAFLTVPAIWLGLNAGLNEAGVFSTGLDLGLSPYVSLGGSVSLTGEDVPKYFDIGHPQEFERERVYNRGPETEAYVKISLPLGSVLSLHVGGGVAVQKRVHVALPPGVIEVGTLDARPLVEILPNGYSETQGHLTLFGGAALRMGSADLGVSVHNRRGWMLGLTLQF